MMVTIRIFLVVVASIQCELHQIDVHNVFHHGDLQLEYMKMPHSFEVQNLGLVCKL